MAECDWLHSRVTRGQLSPCLTQEVSLTTEDWHKENKFRSFSPHHKDGKMACCQRGDGADPAVIG